ncbi:MAG: ABC-2 transporter permease [Ruminococcus sp.]
MKGLLFKDLYIGRKNYIINISVALVFIIAGLLIRASMVYGNLQMYYKSLDATTYYLFSVAPSLLLFTCCGNNGVIIADIRCKWDLFSYSLPVSEKQYALLKYKTKVVFLLTAFILSVLNALVFAVISHRSLSLDIIKYILIIMLFCTLIQSASLPMLLKYRNENAVIARIMIAMVILEASIMFIIFKFKDNYFSANPDDQFGDAFVEKIFDLALSIRDIAAIAAPFIIIISLAAGYFFTVKELKRRRIS